MKKFKAGAVQQRCGHDNVQNREHSATFVRELAADGVKLVLLQELHLGPYFCQTEDTTKFDLAEARDGESTRYFCQLAAELDIVLVISIFEKRATGLYHNTAQVIDGDKGVVGFYRKMHIPDDPGFYEKFYFTPGDHQDPFQPIETRLGKLGVMVCWDQWYPEGARLMALRGADLLLYPTAIGWDLRADPDENERQINAWQTIQRAHGIANGLPVIVANRVGFEVSDDHQDPTLDGIQFWGTSFICGPQGELLAQADRESECVISAEIDLQRSEDVRRIWPYLRDRRVDAYGDITKRFRD